MCSTPSAEPDDGCASETGSASTRGGADADTESDGGGWLQQRSSRRSFMYTNGGNGHVGNGGGHYGNAGGHNVNGASYHANSGMNGVQRPGQGSAPPSPAAGMPVRAAGTENPLLGARRER